MIDLVFLIIGLVGFGIAGYLDVKYTEFPDLLAYGIIGAAVGSRLLYSLYVKSLSIIINATIVGLIFLGFGLLLYFLKQWGDGDAWLFGSLGFLFPTASSFPEILTPINPTFLPFPLVLFFNFFFVALFYVVIYVFVVGLRKKDVASVFVKNVVKNKAIILLSFFGILAFSVFLVAYFHIIYSISLARVSLIFALPPLVLLLLVFIQYAKAVEGKLFRRRVRTKDLKVGDVIYGAKWRGLTQGDIVKIQKRKKYVWIKEGVRFVPVFFITTVVTAIFGNLFLLFV